MNKNNCLLEIEKTLKGYYNIYVTVGDCKRVELKIARPNSKIYFKLFKQLEDNK